MGVIKSKRNQSKILFLENARDLEIYTIHHCKVFPKSYMFLITEEIVSLGRSIYMNVKAANRIFPTDQDEYLKRKGHIIDALCDLDNLTSQLDIAKDLIKHDRNNKKIESSIWEMWQEKINNEIELLEALRKKDKERFKRLRQ